MYDKIVIVGLGPTGFSFGLIFYMVDLDFFYLLRFTLFAFFVSTVISRKTM